MEKLEGRMGCTQGQEQFLFQITSLENSITCGALEKVTQRLPASVRGKYYTEYFSDPIRQSPKARCERIKLQCPRGKMNWL